MSTVLRTTPGPGTSTVVNQGEETRKYTAWNQIPYHPPVKEFKVNQYKELVQDQPQPVGRHHKELERDEELARHNLASSVGSVGDVCVCVSMCCVVCVCVCVCVSMCCVVCLCVCEHVLCGVCVLVCLYVLHC